VDRAKHKTEIAGKKSTVKTDNQANEARFGIPWTGLQDPGMVGFVFGKQGPILIGH
jgi:hypothetical protein